jgi:hypothetical protein
MRFSGAGDHKGGSLLRRKPFGVTFLRFWRTPNSHSHDGFREPLREVRSGRAEVCFVFVWRSPDGGRHYFRYLPAMVFWILYVIRPQRRQVPLVGALLFSLGEVLLVLVHLNIVRDSSTADRSGWAFIATGVLAAFCWIWYFHWRAQAEGSTVASRWRG